jgi:hypothetical protein
MSESVDASFVFISRAVCMYSVSSKDRNPFQTLNVQFCRSRRFLSWHTDVRTTNRIMCLLILFSVDFCLNNGPQIEEKQNEVKKRNSRKAYRSSGKNCRLLYFDITRVAQKKKVGYTDTQREGDLISLIWKIMEDRQKTDRQRDFTSLLLFFQNKGSRLKRNKKMAKSKR